MAIVGVFHLPTASSASDSETAERERQSWLLFFSFLLPHHSSNIFSFYLSVIPRLSYLTSYLILDIPEALG